MMIEIGEDCMISNNIIIRTSDSHPLYSKEGIRFNPARSVKVRNHVWIAPQSTILKGAVIGNNVIVGSKSLVTKTIMDDCLCAGIPAKIIKENVKWTRDALF